MTRAAESASRYVGLGAGLATVGFALGAAVGGWALALGPAIGEGVGLAIGAALAASPERRSRTCRGEGGYAFGTPRQR